MNASPAGVMVGALISLAATIVSDVDRDQEQQVSPGVVVFQSGQDGYHTFRIPAIIRAGNGDLLAFCEGRVASSSDSGNIDLVLRRSKDGGRTWGKLRVIADNGEGVFGNPAPVVDRESGDVVLLLVRQEEGSHEGAIRRGKQGTRTPYLMRSKDHGKTWSTPASLLETCDRADWGWYATGPGHGIQVQHGPHAGRLVVPANHSVTSHGGAYSAHLLLSDDGGRTWRIGATDTANVPSRDVNPNESTVAELSNGDLYISARDQGGRSPANRAHTWSKDGGVTFTAPFSPVRGLQVPVCQGSVLARGDHLLYSGPSRSQARERLAIRESTDRGLTWRELLVVDSGPAAYSDLVPLDGGRVGVLYEAGGYASIRFVPFDA